MNGRLRAVAKLGALILIAALVAPAALLAPAVAADKLRVGKVVPFAWTFPTTRSWSRPGSCR
jgi:hypothetical protein